MLAFFKPFYYPFLTSWPTFWSSRINFLSDRIYNIVINKVVTRRVRRASSTWGVFRWSTPPPPKTCFLYFASFLILNLKKSLKIALTVTTLFSIISLHPNFVGSKQFSIIWTWQRRVWFRKYYLKIQMEHWAAVNGNCSDTQITFIHHPIVFLLSTFDYNNLYVRTKNIRSEQN